LRQKRHIPPRPAYLPAPKLLRYLLDGKCSEKKIVEFNETNISCHIPAILIFRDVTNINPLNNRGYSWTTVFSIQNLYVLPTVSIYVLCVDLRADIWFSPRA